MADQEMRQRDELEEELRRLRPVLQRQRRAAAVRLDAGFQRALRAQLVAAPETAPAQRDIAAAWRTLIAMLVPAAPQVSLRGVGPQVATYTADDVTISLTARPADGAAGERITLYGEVDGPTAGEGMAGATVEALRGEAVVATTALDEWGNFVLPDLPPRVYALRLRFPDGREVIIPPARYAAGGEDPPE
jgi:hypothetical protein